MFQSTCTIGGKVCKLVTDWECCENVVFKEVVQKVGLETEKHPSLYRWCGSRKKTR